MIKGQTKSYELIFVGAFRNEVSDPALTRVEADEPSCTSPGHVEVEFPFSHGILGRGYQS